MQNNSSKINRLLLGIVIVLLLVVIWMLWHMRKAEEGKGSYFKNQTEINENLNISDEKYSWMSTSPVIFGSSVSYPSDWQATPDYYGPPGTIAQGGKEDLVGYNFYLPSGAFINWGGPQSECFGLEIEPFVYGVSTNTCVKNLRTSIGHPSARKTLTTEDLKLFGDFVLKNK